MFNIFLETAQANMFTCHYTTACQQFSEIRNYRNLILSSTNLQCIAYTICFKFSVLSGSSQALYLSECWRLLYLQELTEKCYILSQFSISTSRKLPACILKAGEPTKNLLKRKNLNNSVTRKQQICILHVNIPLILLLSQM